MFCTNCGSPDQNGNFCSGCGASTLPLAAEVEGQTPAQIAASSLPPLQPAVAFAYEGGYANLNGNRASWSSGEPMSLAFATKKCFRMYFVFAGRASRAEYWYFQLFQVIVTLGVVAFIFSLAGIASLDYSKNGAWTVVTAQAAAIAWMVFCVVVFFPSLSVLIRRLHDIGQSGWMYWLSLVPFVGGIILFIFTLQPSQLFRNQFDR